MFFRVSKELMSVGHLGSRFFRDLMLKYIEISWGGIHRNVQIRELHSTSSFRGVVYGFYVAKKKGKKQSCQKTERMKKTKNNIEM